MRLRRPQKALGLKRFEGGWGRIRPEARYLAGSMPKTQAAMRTLIIAALAACLATPAIGQEFRLYAGGNATNVHETKDGDEWKGRPGFQLGADLMLGKMFYLQPGVQLLVRQLKYTTTAEESVPAFEYEYTSQAIRIPLLVGIHLFDPAEEPTLNVRFFGGPSYVRNIKAEFDDEGIEDIYTTQNDQWYLGFGGGVEMGFLFLDAGYDVAMSDVFKGEDLTTNPRANLLWANVGFRLRPIAK
jgi:hypothetical protein